MSLIISYCCFNMDLWTTYFVSYNIQFLSNIFQSEHSFQEGKLPRTSVISQLLLCVIYNLVFFLQQINLWASLAKKHLWLQYNKNKPFVVTAADIYQPICGCSFSLCIIRNIICHFVNTFQPKSLPASVSVWRINALHSACLHFQATT